MLWKILEAHGGKLPDDVHVLFCNTGKEAEETLIFVRECAQRLGVNIVWLEYESNEVQRKRWRVVDFDSASRRGEPLEKIFGDRRFLANPVKRICTAYGKIKPMKYYAQDVLGFKNWDVAIGFRADEPRRVAKLAVPDREPMERIAPLARAGVSVRDVADFWEAADFDLGLPNHGGTSPHGNCDLCFLKGAARVFSLICEKPSRAVWWIGQESRQLAESPGGNLFRKDRPSYAAMYAAALAQESLLLDESCGLEDCACTD
jgi:3'-phosphoadenosine 5'-phosphosulfate sulfotransferase (PAPS reductase)/FAD synthetase